MRTSLVVIKSDSDTVLVVWEAEILLLLRMKLPGYSDFKEYFIIQDMKATHSIDKVYDILECVCLRWNAKDKIDPILPTMVPAVHSGQISVGEWFEILHLASIKGYIHIIRANVSLQRLTPNIQWSHHRFYINRLQGFFSDQPWSHDRLYMNCFYSRQDVQIILTRTDKAQ